MALGADTLDAANLPLALTQPAASPEERATGLARELEPGTRIGRYVVLKKLGSGGMGVVYAAYDEELDRRVALKFLQPELRGSLGPVAAMQRLQREAQVMAKLSHPNVVAVFDVGTFQESIFLAMEFVDGLGMRSWLESKTRTIREIVSTYVQAGRGLEAAHAAGILHRDFKPENAIVDLTNRVRVLDFGVACIDDSSDSTRDISLEVTRAAHSSSSFPSLGRLTSEGELVGTPAYMAPEQLCSERVDARSDQFAFSVALYEALYGQQPYDGTTLSDLVANVKSGRVRPPPSGKKVPRRIRSALLRGLRPEPNERFASMGDLLAELEKEIAVRPTIVVGLGALAVGVVTLLFLALKPAHPALCRGAEQEVAESWGDRQRADVERALVATGSPRAHDVWQRIRPTLDEYAASWATMRTQSCEATRVRGVQSDEALDLRAACLDQRQQELTATVSVLESADVKVLDRAVAMVRGLPDIAQCADVTSLRTPFAEPRDPAKRKMVESVRSDLAQAATLVRARKYDEAEAIARKGEADARTAENRPLEALGSFFVGSALAAKGKDEEARTSLLAAAIEANVARDDVTEARAWTSLVSTVGYNLGRSDESELYARLAGAAVERAGSTDALRATLDRIRANVYFGKGELGKAQRLFQESVDLSPKNSLETARSQVDLADIEALRGKIREVIPVYEVAIAQVTAIEGEGSPPSGVLLIDYVEALVALGEDDLAVQSARRGLAALHEGDFGHARMHLLLAFALLGRDDVASAKNEAAAAFAEYDSTSGPDSPRRAVAYAGWACELARHHLCDDSLPMADRTIAILSKKDVEKRSLRDAQEARALCLDRTGHAKDGSALGTLALKAEDQESASSHGLVAALLAVGEGALGAGDPQSAIRALERGAGVAESIDGYVELRADTHLALARALLAARRDIPRARSLADRAADEYGSTHLPALLATARAVATPTRP